MTDSTTVPQDDPNTQNNAAQNTAEKKEERVVSLEERLAKEGITKAQYAAAYYDEVLKESVEERLGHNNKKASKTSKSMFVSQAEHYRTYAQRFTHGEQNGVALVDGTEMDNRFMEGLTTSEKINPVDMKSVAEELTRHVFSIHNPTHEFNYTAVTKAKQKQQNTGPIQVQVQTPAATPRRKPNVLEYMRTAAQVAIAGAAVYIAMNMKDGIDAIANAIKGNGADITNTIKVGNNDLAAKMDSAANGQQAIRKQVEETKQTISKKNIGTVNYNTNNVMNKFDNSDTAHVTNPVVPTDSSTAKLKFIFR